MDADVIVIGAGAAGLAAARSLSARSLRVILLDARDRVGGRVLSRSLGMSPVPVELGAEFIHGRAAETLTLLRAAGTAAIDADGGESWTYRDGSLQPDDDDSAFGGAIFENSYALPNDESVEHFLSRYERGAGTTQSAAAARAFVEGFDAADPVIASTRAIADEWRSGVDSKTARPLNGYRPLFEHLRNACAASGVRTCLSTTVHRISWRKGAATVDAVSALGAPLSIRARAAVVTLPVGVLRHNATEGAVTFEPRLPANKCEALTHIEMGQVVKVALSFRTAFWARVCAERYRDAAFFRCEGQPFGAYWTQFPVRNASIVAWAGGPKAIALSGASETELISRALSGFAQLLDEPALVSQEFEGGVMHDWGRDQFARGAYSYVTVGGSGARATLATPVDDTLFFAGEATSNDGQSGTVNGALVTGARAADEAALSLGATARTFVSNDG